VFGTSVACPLHNWTIGWTAVVPRQPDEGCTPRFAVKVENGLVSLDSGRAGQPCHRPDPPGGRTRSAHGDQRMRDAPVRETRSTCPYCGVGCGVVIESQRDQITGVRGDPDHPANFGRLCTKGSTLHLTATAGRHAPDAAAATDAAHATWCAARQPSAGTLRWTRPARSSPASLQTHGPDAVGFYISGQLLTEDYYAFNKLAKGLIGTNNIDSNSRLCMSSAVAGYKLTLGMPMRRRPATTTSTTPSASSSSAATRHSRTRCYFAASRTRSRPTRR
jgi:hypothetical protein